MIWYDVGRVGWGELAFMWGELVEMWGELAGASWHKYGASWLGRVGFGANRLAPILSLPAEEVCQPDMQVGCLLWFGKSLCIF